MNTTVRPQQAANLSGDAVSSKTDTTDRTQTSDLVSNPTDVCIANPWFYPVVVGPGERFRRYSPGLVRRGVQLSVITVGGGDLADSEIVDGIPVTRIASAAGSRKKGRTVAYRALGRLMGSKRPDVFQVFSSDIWNVPLVWALKLRGVPSVFVATMVAEGSGTGRRGWLRKVFRRYVLSGYARIVTSSGVMTEILRKEASGPDSRIITISNGVDLKRFTVPTQAEKFELRKRLNLSSGPLVLFVGGIYPRKAVDTLLQGWHRVSTEHRAQLVIVGPRPDEVQFKEFHRRVDELAATAPRPESVLFTGGVRNVDEYMKAADLFVFPSEREGMPNVVPEAMATGLPAILTAFKGLPEEFGRPDEEYLLVERTAEGLGDAMNLVLGNQEEATRLGAKARAWVEDELNVERSLDAYTQLYAGLANRNA